MFGDANGYDMQLWETCKKYAEECEIKIEIKGDSFFLTYKRESLGKSNTLAEVYKYLCGFSDGFSKGRCRK